MVIVEMATGHYLDYFGDLYGVIRTAGEPDFSYRQRILDELKTKQKLSEQERRMWIGSIYD